MILEVENIGFAYTEGNPVFKGISFGVDSGEVLSILGRNGVGKSTLIQCILNILKLSTGRVCLMGQDLRGLEPQKIAALVGYVPQGHQVVFPFSVFEFVLMGRAPHVSVFRTPKKEDYRVTGQALQKTGIAHLANKTIGEISGGERQMAMIARTLAQAPKILLFDEPTSHLDLANQLKVLSVIEMLSQEGIAIIMSTHFPDHGFLISQRIAIMQNGRFVAEGSAEEVITPANLREAYGIDIDVCYVQQAGRRVCIPRNGLMGSNVLPSKKLKCVASIL